MQTKMTVRIEVSGQRTLRGQKHQDVVQDVDILGATMLELVFPGTPDETTPIMQDILDARINVLLAQAVMSFKLRLEDRVVELDLARDLELEAPKPTEVV